MGNSDPRCKHDKVLCSQCVVITDAAKRIAESVGLALVCNPIEVTAHGWMAFALENGSTDHAVYPSKESAIEHQGRRTKAKPWLPSNEFLFAYICLNKCLGGMPLKDAQLWLDLHRHLYRNNGRMTDPRTLIMPQGRDQFITRPTFGSDQPGMPRYRGPQFR